MPKKIKESSTLHEFLYGLLKNDLKNSKTCVYVYIDNRYFDKTSVFATDW